MKFFVFAIVFILVIGLASWYVARQLLLPAKIHRRGKIIAVSVIAYIVLATPVTIIFRSFGIENFAVDIMAWFGYTGLGFMSFVFTFLAIRDSIRLLSTTVLKFWKRLIRKASNTHENSETLDYDRRRFLLNGINTSILAGAGVFTGYGVAEAKQIPDVKNVPISIQGLPADLNGFKIVQITDIHVSPTIKRNFVQSVIDVVNSLSADVVALTGDLVDGSVRHLTNDVDPLKQLRSTHGNFFVTGNHEYYSGVLAWIEKVRTLGFTILLNENRLITHGQGRILLAGVTDYRAGSFYESHQSDPFKAIAGARPAHVKILLAHQPKNIFDAARAGFDLQISGHTHGGQFYPWNLFAGIVQPFVKGLHRHQNTQIYVSSGTGYWGPPIRVGSPSEITLIKLVQA